MSERAPRPGGPRAPQRHGLARRMLPRLILVLVVIAAGVWFSSGATSWVEVRGALATVSGPLLFGIALLALVNLVSYWLVLAASVPRLGIARAAAAHLPATALSNSLPAGGALGTGYTVQALRGWGVPATTITSALVVNGILGMTAKLSVALVAALVAARSGGEDVGIVLLTLATTAGLVGAATLLLRSEQTPRLIGGAGDRVVSLLRRQWSRIPPFNASRAALGLQAQTQELITTRFWLLIGATVLSHGTLFLLFLVCLRGVGAAPDAVTTLDLLVAYGLSRVITLVSLTPGGVGLVEVSLSATIIAMGAPAHEAIAGVLLFRTTSYLLPTAVGLVVLAARALAPRNTPTVAPLANSPVMSGHQAGSAP